MNITLHPFIVIWLRILRIGIGILIGFMILMATLAAFIIVGDKTGVVIWLLLFVTLVLAAIKYTEDR